ncbi:protocadherin-23 isoform X2 [Nannospalax galili]|nr:protocadherin-23 isoform X2 [Nannospalax galili]
MSTRELLGLLVCLPSKVFSSLAQTLKRLQDCSAIPPQAGSYPEPSQGAGGQTNPSGRRMGKGRQRPGSPGGQPLGASAQRSLIRFFVHAWLWASSGSSAQVFNLRLSVDEGLPPDTLVGDIRAGLPAAQQQEGGGFFLSEDSDDSPLLDDFHVHPDTGIIRTARRLDRERRDHYSFVAATLLGEVVQVEIHVNDVNDHSPSFPRDSLLLDVSELSPPGTAFRLPDAQDPDSGRFSIQGYTLRQAYGLLEDPAGPFFRLRYGTSGPPPSQPLPESSPSLEPLDLVLLRRLDREVMAQHELQIEAWDGGSPRRTGSLQVHLRVLDENDNPPVFEQDEYPTTVREDAPPGTEVCRVHATDRDLGPNGLVRYSIRERLAVGASAGGVPSGDSAYFSVEELSGVVRVRRPLDREAQAWHQLVVQATDGGAEPEVATVRVSIAVLDVNDNQPAIHLIFLTEGGTASVSEGARPGDYVARVSVSDADGDPEKEEAAGTLGAGLGTGSISLFLDGGEGAFALKPGGPPGVFFLCVEGPLDRESRDLYELRLVATDAGSPPLSTEETLLLRVADLNDQRPVFSQEHYWASVSEAAGPGTAVVWVSATDADEAGTNHTRLNYALIHLSAACNSEALSPKAECAPSFSINPDSGAISTTRSLDREVQERVELRVVAQDQGEPRLSATCLVSITVEDVNDNEPVFRKQVYNVTLAEHTPVGHCFLQVKASDADAGLYGLVEYSLYDGFQSYEAPPAFQIDPRDGQICVSQDIDRERDPTTFDLLVKAKDGGGLSAQAFVRVELEDVNDNHPVFNPSTYVTSISIQSHPGTEIVNVLASDRDSGIYGTVAYELIPGDLSSFFTIDPLTGIIYLTSTLSHLEATTLFLMVGARDGGGLTADTNADVTIHILQTTLAPAEFERPKYSFSVYEDAPIGSFVGTVKAGESSNSSEPISYRISSGDLDRKFSIHQWLGTIHTQKPLDHEAQPTVVLTIQAQLGSSSACSSTEVNITVIDVNDNQPKFPTASDEIKISQTTPPGTALYLARAEDRDSGLNGLVRYAIASPKPSVFSVDPGFGVLYLSGNLDGQVPGKLTLTLVAEDHGAPPQASQLVLTIIIDKQEQSPVLAFENLVYQVEVSESLPLTTQILQVQAYPLHLWGPTSQMVYTLDASVDSAAFGIHSHTGWIYLRRQLDYESTQTYRFRVFARIPEGRLLPNVSTSVIVHVLDENDNSPVFLHDVMVLKVEESPTPLGVIGKITAIDTDSGKNGQLSYFLLSDGKFFRMNPNTGELISWLALDREHQGHHQLTVLVTDHGSPPRNATTVVYITVTDINDNRPFFPQCLPGKEFHIKVLEGQPVNTLVTTVFAKDLDEGHSAEVTYSVSSDYPAHFKIDANSGEVRTTTVLSHDYRPSYRIAVIASDQGLPPLQGQAIINIQVIPLSKGRIFMSQNIRHLVIPENTKPAKIMSLMKPPSPLQQHHNGKLHFSIFAEDKDDHFEIDSSTGDLFLSEELDYEITSHYLIRVISKDHSHDPPLNSTIFLSVDVEDQNDHFPSFQDEFIVISVEENAAVGTLVYVFNAKDGDGSFLNRRIQYFMESSHVGTNPFLIHPSSGTLVTASPLDREDIPTFILTITASDQAVNVTDRRWRSLVAEVVILDVNDHSPSFVSYPVAYVREDAAVGSLVHHVSAQDPDAGMNGEVTYSILSGNANTAFTLDKSSGLLMTARPLDYEVKTQHVLTLVALDGGTPALSSSQTLTITVLDVNDETPVFTQYPYEVSVKENQSPGAFVTRVEAKDTDSGVNSKLQFEIMPGPFFGLFEINRDTGDVVTMATFDRETQEVFTLRVLVRDGGVPSLSSTTVIVCTIEDENDHAPELIFSSDNIEVLENQEPGPVYTVLAFDMDAGNNGTITYHIFGGNVDGYFAIHVTSGELSTTRPLDREQINNFTLIILCSDMGTPPRSSLMQLKVRVLDDNDHSPSFPMLHYQAPVREDAEVSSVVLMLSAVDRDEGLNGQIEYFLMEETSGAFTIDLETGTLRTRHTLDREATSQHIFQVMARDRSIQDSRSTTITVQVSVTDVNDNDPVWEQNPIDAFLSPNLSINQNVVHLRASDPDAGPNGTVIFSFTDTQSMFSIDEYTGEVKLQQNLSSECFPIWVQLKVTDQGVPGRTATGLLVIHMEGENRKISFSHQLYKGLVNENCEAGTSIVTVKAFAPVSIQDTLKYSIFSGNEDEVFAMGSNSGQLTVREPKFLDFEVRNEVQLIVFAEIGGYRAYSKVEVSIEDVNDNSPRFEQSVYWASVTEGQPCSAHVTQVFATDLDGGLNGLIQYSIVSGNQGEVFQIDSQSGVVTTSAILDYESTISYSLIVQATDRGVPRRSDTTVIKIQVTDINDNAPTFLPSDAVEIAENSLPGVIVSQVSVRDVDLSPAFIFSLAEESNPGTKFAIHQDTGVVVVVGALDFEETSEYELLVQISDSVHHIEGFLTVHVLDINDNPPVFSQDFYQATISESVPIGYSVLTLSATDLEHNGTISYRILSSSKEFSIDPLSGTIVTTNPVLLVDKIPTIRFLVEASDGGIPALKALTLVEIEIQDVNKYAPEFAEEYYNLSLGEDAPIGSTLLVFSTIDHDWTVQNTHVEYSIISGNSQNNFHIETSLVHSEYPHKQFGSLMLLHTLDREASASHKLVVLASDHGCPPLSSTAIITIEVLDVNDNPPTFSSQQYQVHVKESTPVGSHITVVSADDPDMGSHARIIYGIISGNEKEQFYLEETTGVLYLLKPLDYEKMIKFTLTVHAADAEQKYDSFATVLINVLDDNDHVPRFMSPTLTCVVPEDLPAFSTVCSVHALDFDAGPYGDVTYTILSPCLVTQGMPSFQDLFVIDPLTGDIHTEKMLDYESIDKYCLVVQAKDRGGSTASLVVWVQVEGIDEFEPIFTQDQYFFNLPKKNQGQQLIGRVEASDADAGVDGVILYSLETSSPYFSVNKTSGNIYWLRAPFLINDQLSKEDTLEVKIIAHSPKPGSKFTSCSVFVNVSLSSEGRQEVVFVHSFSISLTVSFLVFLLLVCTLIVLILRRKQKDPLHSYEKKSSASTDINPRLTGAASEVKATQETTVCRDAMGPTGAMPTEWLNLMSVMEKDIAHLYRHSNSSGHCSVDGETAEDKEIQRINEHPYRKDSDSALSDRGSRVPDSGIPRDSDQLSCLSGETDMMASTEVAEVSNTFEGGDGEEDCNTICVPNHASPQKREAKAGVLPDSRKESIALSTQMTSDDFTRGHCAWNYLLSWEPKFQHLASVFNDIAKLKDEHLQMPGIPKDQSFVFPPPLITAVAEPGIKAVPPRMPVTALGPVLQKFPRSPLPYHGGSLPEAMTPSFSPSLSLLTMLTPARSPRLPDGELGTHTHSACCERNTDEAQI